MIIWNQAIHPMIKHHMPIHEHFVTTYHKWETLFDTSSVVEHCYHNMFEFLNK